MPKLFLPSRYAIKHPDTKREMILIIPGAESMPKSQLQEIIQWQREKAMKELGQVKPKPKYGTKEVSKALNEFALQLEKRKLSAHNKLNY